MFLSLMLAAQPPAYALDLSSCVTDDLSLPADIEVVKEAVLSVEVPGGGSGTAVFVTPSGTALTAAHVVGRATKVEVRTSKGLVLGASVVRVMEDVDLALLEVEGRGHSCLRPVDTRLPAGADVFAVGSPAGPALASSVSKGIVSGYPELDGRSFLQTDSSLNPGNSGGPIVDAHGRLAAIASWKVAGTDYEGLGFGVPFDVVEDVLASQPEGSERAGVEVQFESPRKGVTVGILHLASRSTTTAYGDVSLVRRQIEDLCVMPCVQTLEPGTYTWVAHGPSVEAVEYPARVGTEGDHTFVAKPRPSAVGAFGRGSAIVGLVTASLGATLWLTTDPFDSSDGLQYSPAITAAGGALALGGGGILLATKGRWKEP